MRLLVAHQLTSRMEDDSIVGSDTSMVLALRLDSRRMLCFTTPRAHLQHDTGTTLHSHSDGLGAEGIRIPPRAVILTARIHSIDVCSN